MKAPTFSRYNEKKNGRKKAKKQKIKEAGFVHGKYEGNEQQLPAMFDVDPDGSVVYAHYAKNSIDMPTVEEMFRILDGLSAPQTK